MNTQLSVEGKNRMNIKKNILVTKNTAQNQLVRTMKQRTNVNTQQDQDQRVRKFQRGMMVWAKKNDR